jgi:hypothetical protein
MLVVAALLVALQLCIGVRGGWIDPDTEKSSYRVSSQGTGETHDLVFSDEFNVNGRTFGDGNDPRWTAIHKNDYTNDALQFYNRNLAKTRDGSLQIKTIIEDVSFKAQLDTKGTSGKMTKNYQSAMLQGWNKFCFTGGIVEIRARLPGKSDIGGLWPAMWMLGNLARATYVGSSNNMWPWSFDKCDKKFQSGQKVSACNAVNHFDFEGHKGRGAPEIDLVEAMPGNNYPPSYLADSQELTLLSFCPFYFCHHHSWRCGESAQDKSEQAVLLHLAAGVPGHTDFSP